MSIVKDALEAAANTLARGVSYAGWYDGYRCQWCGSSNLVKGNLDDMRYHRIECPRRLVDEALKADPSRPSDAPTEGGGR